MKKQGFILLALVIMVTLTACGGSGAESSSAEGSAGAGAGSVVAAPFAEVVGRMDDQGRTVVYTNVDKTGALTVDSKANLVDDKGKMILSTDFCDLRPVFGSDYYAFQEVTDGPWGLMTAEGKQLKAPFAEDIALLSEKDGKAVFSYKKDGHWGVYDLQTDSLTDAMSESLPLAAGAGFVHSKNGYMGLAAKDGSLLTEADFDWIGLFGDSDEALYKRGSEQGILNTSGQVVRTLEIDGALQPASILNGLPVSYEKDGRWGLLDKDFKVLREPFSDQAVVMVSSEQKGQSYGLYDEKRRIGLLNAKGDLVRKPFADEIGAFTRDGYAVYKDGDHGGIVDVNGKDIKVPKNQGIENFNELGYAAFQQDGAWGLLDEKGKVVLKPTYAELRPFNKAPLAWFKEKPKDKWGIVALK